LDSLRRLGGSLAGVRFLRFLRLPGVAARPRIAPAAVVAGTGLHHDRRAFVDGVELYRQVVLDLLTAERPVAVAGQ